MGICFLATNVQDLQSLIAFNRAIEINRDTFNYWYGKGAVLYKMGKYSEANSAFAEALLLEPNNETAKHYLELIEQRLSNRLYSNY